MPKPTTCPPYFPFYHDDFLAGVFGLPDPLDDEQAVIYLVFLCLQWRHQGPLDDDPAALAKKLRRHVRPVSRVLDLLVSKGKLVRAGGKIWNRRMQREIEKNLRREVRHAPKKPTAPPAEQRTLPLLRSVGPQPAQNALMAALESMGKNFRRGG